MSNEARREFMLAALRTAVLRVKLMENELTTIGLSLKHNMIDDEGVIKWLRDEGLMFLIPCLDVDWSRSNGSSTDTSATSATQS